MPLEGHWRRINTPLRRLTARERNVAIAAIAVTLAAIVAIVIVTLPNSRPAPAPGCIYAVVAGFTGAEPVEACGARARHICDTRTPEGDPGAAAIRESCHEAGLL
jgi:type II secretory pathway component PulM